MTLTQSILTCSLAALLGASAVMLADPRPHEATRPPAPGGAGPPAPDAGSPVPGPGTHARAPGGRVPVPGSMVEAADAYATLSTLEGLLLHGGDDLRVEISTSRRPGPASVRVLVRLPGRGAVVRTGPSVRAALGEALAVAYCPRGECRP